MILECFKNKKFRTLWSAGCMTGVARAMEFLALSLFILQDIGLTNNEVLIRGLLRF